MVKTLYIAHNFLTRKKIREWELKIEKKYNINLDNPFYDNPDRAEEMLILDSFKECSRAQRAYLSTRSSYDIVENDLEKIRKSDGIIAILNDVRIGSPMEVFYASRILRIPVYIVTRKYNSHPWVIQHAAKIFTNRKELEAFIRKKYGVILC